MLIKMNVKHLSFILILINLHCVSLTNAEEDSLESEISTPEEDQEPSSTTSRPTPNEFEIVSLDHGDIKGTLDWSSTGNHFYSFLGIPYAKPPTGERRFKNPEIVTEKWEGVRDGSKAPPPCAQFDINQLILQPKISFLGDEDCLYLNIFTPEPNMEYANLPVLVYIHGGHFVSGSAKDYEPHTLMNAPIVLVIIQFRLGILGFMSTEDHVMPGNLGLKDQTLALKWINEFIEKFGGDPTKVTVFGSGSGAASLHYQIMSHHTIGLFQRAILQSGNSLCPWAKGGVHRDAAYHVGKYFGCLPEEEEKAPSNSTDVNNSKEEGTAEKNENEEEIGEEKEENESREKTVEKDENEESVKENGNESETNESEKTETIAEKADENDDNKDSDENMEEEDEEKLKEEEKNTNLLKCLQEVDVEKLVLSAELFYMWSHLPVIFGPYVDGRYMPESPEFLLKLGRHKRVDMIIGTNRDDGSLLTNSMLMSEGRRMALKHHFPLVGPISLEFSDDDVAPLNMSIKAYDKYCGGLSVDASDAYNLTKLYTDRHYTVCSDMAAEWHSENNQRYKKNVYFYELTHRGQRSTGDEFGLNLGKEWISLGDELYYLFPMNKSRDFVRDEDDEKMTELFVRMWYYFSMTGNPTPNGTLDFQWNPFTKETKQHLNLSLNPSMEEDGRAEVRDFWKKLPTRQNIFFDKEYFLKILEDAEQNRTNTDKINENEENDESGEKDDNNNNNNNNENNDDNNNDSRVKSEL